MLFSGMPYKKWKSFWNMKMYSYSFSKPFLYKHTKRVWKDRVFQKVFATIPFIHTLMYIDLRQPVRLAAWHTCVDKFPKVLELSLVAPVVICMSNSIWVSIVYTTIIRSTEKFTGSHVLDSVGTCRY